MNDLRGRLIEAIYVYGNSERADSFDAEDMADYLIENIEELREL